MSYLSEKVSYLKGLAEGLDLDVETKEGKLLKAIIDALEDTADAIGEVVEIQDEMQLQLDDVDDDLSELESVVYEEDYDDDDDDDEDDDCLDCDDEISFECPGCGDLIYLDPELIESGEETITCPNCNEEIELDFDCDCEDCCDCD